MSFDVTQGHFRVAQFRVFSTKKNVNLLKSIGLQLLYTTVYKLHLFTTYSVFFTKVYII